MRDYCDLIGGGEIFAFRDGLEPVEFVTNLRLLRLPPFHSTLTQYHKQQPLTTAELIDTPFRLIYKSP